MNYVKEQTFTAVAETISAIRGTFKALCEDNRAHVSKEFEACFDKILSDQELRIHKELLK